MRVLHLDTAGVEVPALSLRVGEHAELRARSTYAWRARAHAGALLLELPRTPPPADAEESVATVHVRDCG